MKTELDHLPRLRQQQLRLVVRVLLEEFEKKVARGTQPWIRAGRILKIILYGSFARGDWVDDDRSGYLSDFDILVVVNHPKLADKVDYWQEADDRLLRRTIMEPRFPTTNFILHDYADVNDKLTRGRPFFIDIHRDGVALYEAKGFPLATPGHMPPDLIREETIGNFQGWLPDAESALRLARTAVKDGSRKWAAFLSHQAAENAYTCVLLTLTLYCPQEHSIRRLRNWAEDLAPELRTVWPPANGLSRRTFELIKNAYVKARYSKHYRITDEELAYGFARLEELNTLVRQVCERHLAGMGIDATTLPPPDEETS